MVFSKCLDVIEENAPKHQTKSSSQAKCTKSTSFFTCVRKKVDLVPLACEDEIKVLNIHKSNIIGLELAIDPPSPPPVGILYTMIF